MSEFNASLLREKFVIHDTAPAAGGGRMSITALSNRLKMPLESVDGTIETWVVRAQNMHTTARYAAQMVKDFADYGSLVHRVRPFDWKGAWEAITKGYESDWNPKRWIAVYHKGHIVFEDGRENRHSFLDVIEQCDAVNKEDYEHALAIAIDAFKKAGRDVSIEHDSNVALIMKVHEKEGKCGVIVRGPNKTTTFNLTAHPKGGRSVKASQCLTAAAAFLEGIQLAFAVGMGRQKRRYGLIEAASDESHKMEAASQKLGRLNTAINQFESLLNVVYRPERPNFGDMVDEAEEFARKALADQIEAKIASGEFDKDDWVV